MYVSFSLKNREYTVYDDAAGGGTLPGTGARPIIVIPERDGIDVKRDSDFKVLEPKEFIPPLFGKKDN